MTQKLFTNVLYAGGIIVFLLFAYIYGVSVTRVNASAPSGLNASVATTSQQAVTTTASRVFATSTNCAARIITTVASPVMISFSDLQGIVPTGILGHLQAASTTVSYDGGIYGCDAVRIYSFTNSTITVSETR